MMKRFGVVLFVTVALCVSAPFMSCDDDGDNPQANMLSQACEKLVGCQLFPSIDTCKDMLNSGDVPDCGYLCILTEPCATVGDCSNPTSAVAQRYCGVVADGDQYDMDQSWPDGDVTDTTDVDVNDYFGDCDPMPEDYCAQMRCSQKTSYDSCLNMYDETTCAGLLSCVYTQQNCACPGGVYDANAGDQCNSDFTACATAFWESVDTTDGDTGDSETVDTDLIYSRCDDIQYLGGQCYMAVCPMALDYIDCVSGSCEAIGECVQTLWDCVCPQGNYAGTQNQYNCQLVYRECVAAYGIE